MGNDTSSPADKEEDSSDTINALEAKQETTGEKDLSDKEQPSSQPDAKDEETPGSAEEQPALVPEEPVQGEEVEPFDWDSIAVERQAEHFLFLLGMVLALAEVGDCVLDQERCDSQKLLDLVKALPPVVTAKELMYIANEMEDEKVVIAKDVKQAERPYPRGMWQQWQSWVSSQRSLLADDLYIHKMEERSQVLYAICVSEQLNSVMVVLGYRDKPDPKGIKYYDIEEDTGRSVGVDAAWGDVLAGTQAGESTLVSDILNEITQVEQGVPVRLAIVGYGGGGALATVLSLVLSAARNDSLHVWTFHAPSIGDVLFQEKHAALQDMDKLRHVRVANSFLGSFHERSYSLGVPLILRTKEYYARKQLWKILSTCATDGMSKQFPLTLASLADCIPRLHLGSHPPLAEYWQRLLAMERNDVPFEEWYKDAPARQQAMRSRIKKQVIVLLLFLVFLVLGLYSMGTPPTEKVPKRTAIHVSETADGVKQASSPPSKQMGGDNGNTRIVSADPRKKLEHEDRREGPQTPDSDMKKDAENEDKVESPKSLDSDIDKEAEDQDQLESPQTLDSDAMKAVGDEDQVESSHTTESNMKQVVVDEDEVESPHTPDLDTEEAATDEDRVEALHSPDSDVKTATADEDSVESQRTSDSNRTVELEMAVEEEKPDTPADSSLSALDDKVEVEQPGETERLDESERLTTESANEIEEPASDESDSQAASVSEPEVLEVPDDNTVVHEKLPLVITRSMRPLNMPLFNIGLAFNTEKAMLSRASAEIQQWVTSVLSSRASEAAAKDAVNSWDDQYWDAKHDARNDAMEAMKTLHEKLLSSIPN